MQPTQDERWLPIPGYEGRYDVSDQGRVRSWVAYNGTPVPRIRKPAPNGWGYLSLPLSDAHLVRTTERVHALVMLTFIGPRPDGMERLHRDGDQTNNALVNLVYGTSGQNRLDTVRHGTDHNASKTHCHKGHPFDDENTGHFSGRAGRFCKTCKRALQQGYKKARRAA